VLVIIGLLMGAVLKGKQLQDSARVRKLADVTTGVEVAYLAFQDRYRRVPGDWSAAGASAGIGEPITGGGNENGRLDNPPGANVYDEVNALWEQLSKAGIIKGRYPGDPRHRAHHEQPAGTRECHCRRRRMAPVPGHSGGCGRCDQLERGPGFDGLQCRGTVLR